MSSTDLQHLYNKAWLFASHAHVGQMMKGSDLPYTTHVAMVANELIFADRESDIGDLAVAMPAALLHDVIEDTGTSEEALAGVFGAAVASTVACLSKNLIVPFSDEGYFQAIAAHSREAAAIRLGFQSRESLMAFSTSSRVCPVLFWMRPTSSSCLPSA